MNEEIVYGLKPVMEALRGSRRAFELFVLPGDSPRTAELLQLAAERRVPVRRRDKGDIARLCGTDHHQGVALRVEAFRYLELHELLDRWRGTAEAGLVLVLDGIQDPHNLGAMIRSAACAGAHGIIVPKDRAAGVTSAVEKVAAGAVETVPVARVTNVAQALEELKEAGFWVYGAAGEATQSIFSLDLTGSVALVIGNEGEGLRPLVRRKCDGLVSIPLRGGVSSLNASVAAGILLFEAVRQRAPLTP